MFPINPGPCKTPICAVCRKVLIYDSQFYIDKKYYCSEHACRVMAVETLKGIRQTIFAHKEKRNGNKTNN